MLELTLRSTAILVSAWLLASSMRRATAATRHLVWHGALIAVLSVPLIGPIAPKFAVPGLSSWVQEVQEVQEVQGVQGVLIAATGSTGLPAEAPSGAKAGATGLPADLSSVAPEGAEAEAPSEAKVGAAMVIVPLGALSVALWFAVGWVVTAMRVRRSTPAPLEWQLELNALRERYRMTRDVRLGIVPGPGSPLAAGIWHAAILLPELSLQWTAERRRAVLVHELAHIRRADCRVQLVTQLACAIYWFNPLIWIAARHLRSERERACDDEVLRAGARPSIYASHLLEIAREVQPALRPSAALAMARPSELEGRLLAVLAEARARIPSRGGRWAVTASLSAITAFALGASAAARPQSPATESVAPGSAPNYSVQQEVISRADRLAARATQSQAEAVLQQSPDPQKRQQAALEIADAGGTDAIASLRAALNDSSQDVREKAALGLAFLSGREVVPALLEALANRDPQVREKAAIGLALRRDERAIAPLITAMSDVDSQVREKAAIALGTSGDPRARDPLLRALNDPDPQVREKASAGLILLGVTKER